MADDPTNLTLEKLLATKQRFDAAVAVKREEDAAAGLCVCQHCFGDRLAVLMLGAAIHLPRRCLNDPGERWWREYEERQRARVQGEG